MPIDENSPATLQELEGDDWGDPPFSSHVVTECHRLRRVPLRDFTVEDCRLLIGQGFSLALLLLTSCGGKVETDASGTPTGAQDCSLPNEWFTSTEAVRLVRCPEVAGPDAVVISVVSDRNGEMDEYGRAPRWDLMTWSQSAQQRRWVQLHQTDGVIMDERVDSSCPDPPSTDPAPSDEVIPDAMDRVAPLDPYEDKQYTARFYIQQYEPCLMNPGSSGVGVIRSTTREDSVSFYLDYTWTGDFSRICGPCPGGVSLQCEDNCR